MTNRFASPLLPYMTMLRLKHLAFLPLCSMRTLGLLHFTCCHEDCSPQRMAQHGESQESRRGAWVNADLLDIQRVNDKIIPMRTVSRWRRRTDKPFKPQIVRQLQSAFRQAAAMFVACAGRQFGDAGRDVDDRPVPQARSGRGIRVIRGDGETLRAFGRTRPFQMGRKIFAPPPLQTRIAGEARESPLQYRYSLPERPRLPAIWQMGCCSL